MTAPILQLTPDLRRDVISLEGSRLDTLLPLHLVVSCDGVIQRCGPTMAKLLDLKDPVGRDVFDLIRVVRPRDIDTVPKLRTVLDQRLSLCLAGLDNFRLKGVAVELPEGDLLVHLSPGASVVGIVAARALSDEDFSPADPTMEMLYLFELQRVLMEESKNLNERLQGAKTAAEEQAFTDPLTGLANRRALDRHLARLLRRQSDSPFAVMQIDLDFFKQVNDTQGHAAGDHVLRVVSERLLCVTRPTDFVARIGGDEFVVVANDAGPAEQVKKVGARIISATERAISFKGQTCQISASVGAVLNSDPAGLDADGLLDRADAALYRSKDAGRGRFTLWAKGSEDPPDAQPERFPSSGEN